MPSAGTAYVDLEPVFSSGWVRAVEQEAAKAGAAGSRVLGGFLSKALQPPSQLNVTAAVERLKQLQALDEREELTPLGRHLAGLPVDPGLGKMLFAVWLLCLVPALTPLNAQDFSILDAKLDSQNRLDYQISRSSWIGLSTKARWIERKCSGRTMA